MDAFGYLSVLLSIILGLGLTQLLTALGRMIRHRERVRMDWLPLVWAGILIIVYVQVWWSMYSLRTYREWTFVKFVVVLAQVMTLYLMAAVALPEQVEEGGLDLAQYFERQHRWFFAFFLATLVVSVLKDLILDGRLPTPTNLAFHAALGVACLVGIKVERRRAQEWLSIVVGVLIMVYIGLLFTHLR